MQVIPIVLLAMALLLELMAAVTNLASNFSLFQDVWRWTTMISAVLSLSATIASSCLLILNKYSSAILGFMITLLSTITFAVFTAMALSWWIN